MILKFVIVLSLRPTFQEVRTLILFISGSKFAKEDIEIKAGNSHYFTLKFRTQAHLLIINQIQTK